MLTLLVTYAIPVSLGDLFVCVSVPPTVYNIKNMTQSEGLSTTLVCLSWGDPAPEMTYRKEGHTEDYVLGSNVILFLQNHNTSSCVLVWHCVV